MKTQPKRGATGAKRGVRTLSYPFTTIIKSKFDSWMRQAAFNVARGMKILSRASI
jgi:hypothetical protein